jgi:hypothetical protein
MNETIKQLAERHGFSPDLAQTLLDELRRNGGRQAQFNDPALGGMGMWQSGQLMIGDMINHRLKAKVAAFLADLAALLQASPDASPELTWRAEKMASMAQNQASISQSGGGGGFSVMQNGVSYRYTADRNELVVNETDVYDTTGLRILGIHSQQQNGRGTLVLNTDQGPRQIGDLKRVR